MQSREPWRPHLVVVAERAVRTAATFEHAACQYYRTWRRRIRAALPNATPAPDALRTRAGDTLALLPFQLEPALAVTRGRAARILIADVGLGKTIQAGLIINKLCCVGQTGMRSSSHLRGSGHSGATS